MKKKVSVVFYSFSTNNTRKFINKLKHDNVLEIQNHNPFQTVDNDFIIVIPSYEMNVYPELYDILEDFFETDDNIKNCKGIFASGNINFMSLYGVTAKHFSTKYNIPVLHSFEFQGTKHDIKRMKEELIKIG